MFRQQFCPVKLHSMQFIFEDSAHIVLGLQMYACTSWSVVESDWLQCQCRSSTFCSVWFEIPIQVVYNECYHALWVSIEHSLLWQNIEWIQFQHSSRINIHQTFQSNMLPTEYPRGFQLHKQVWENILVGCIYYTNDLNGMPKIRYIILLPMKWIG